MCSIACICKIGNLCFTVYLFCVIQFLSCKQLANHALCIFYLISQMCLKSDYYYNFLEVQTRKDRVLLQHHQCPLPVLSDHHLSQIPFFRMDNKIQRLCIYRLPASHYLIFGDKQINEGKELFFTAEVFDFIFAIILRNDSVCNCLELGPQ